MTFPIFSNWFAFFHGPSEWLGSNHLGIRFTIRCGIWTCFSEQDFSNFLLLFKSLIFNFDIFKITKFLFIFFLFVIFFLLLNLLLCFILFFYLCNIISLLIKFLFNLIGLTWLLIEILLSFSDINGLIHISYLENSLTHIRFWEGVDDLLYVLASQLVVKHCIINRFIYFFDKHTSSIPIYGSM